MMTEAVYLRRVSLLLVMTGLVSLPFADFELTATDLWIELEQIARGAVAPQIDHWPQFLTAVANTLSFAFQGVALGAAGGFVLSLLYGFSLIRACCAFLRAIHELFWALLFMQLFGLSPLTGLLALAIPYAGTFAKVFGEIYEETDHSPAVAVQGSRLSVFFYTTLPLAWRRMAEYTAYRFECGIRSSAILGFVGLPTIGFYMESLFRQGEYAQAIGLLYALFVIIGSVRLWLKGKLVPLYVVAAFVWLPPVADLSLPLLWQFFVYDIVPAPLRTGQDTLLPWVWMMVSTQVVPGVMNTLILGQISLVVTLLLSLTLFPVRSRLLVGHWRVCGHGLLVVLRSCPEYLLAFLGVIIFGPSMLPGVLALGLHNAGILAHLTGRYVDELILREDAPKGLLLYCYELLPRIYRQFMALLLYRWEVIQRESAILGILGIPTLGFYIDSAFEELRLDRAVLLIVITAGLNMLVDSLARLLRSRSGPGC